jgi:excisionase family DNA binding protein
MTVVGSMIHPRTALNALTALNASGAFMPKTTARLPEFLTTDEVAAMTGTKRRWIQVLAQRGELAAERLVDGGEWRIRSSAVAAKLRITLSALEDRWRRVKR